MINFNRSKAWWRGAVALLALAALGLALLGRHAHGLYPSPLAKDKIAVVPIYDEIVNPDEVVHVLTHYRDDVPGIQAVVLAIDSPGGGVAASQEICEAVQSLRDNGITVVAALGSVAASGGYYIACNADKVVADPGTLTGSIGVIMETMNAQKILNKVGLDYQVVKSGEFKDAGSFARGLTPRERVLFQGVIDDVYGQFVDVVSTQRRGPLAAALAKRDKLDAAKVSDAEIVAYVKSFADGRVFSGRKAMQLGLVDDMGGLEKAIDEAADLAGVDNPDVVTYREPKPLAEWLTGVSKAELRSWARLSLGASAPRFGYFAW